MQAFGMGFHEAWNLSILHAAGLLGGLNQLRDPREDEPPQRSVADELATLHDLMVKR